MFGDELRYTFETRRGDRNRQIGVHAYSYWAMALDPRTKKYLPKILNHRDRRLLWEDIKECCLVEARATRIENQEEDEEIDAAGANDNLPVEQRNRRGAASFFPDSSDEEMEDSLRKSF